MSRWHPTRYLPTAEQRTLLERWLPESRLVADHSWGLVENAVWELTSSAGRFIAKFGGPSDHHLAREIHAHLHWLLPWTTEGRAPELVHHDLEANMVLTRFLPGDLVLGSPYQNDPAVFEQAGALLAQLHDQPSASDPDHEQRENQKTLAWLDRPHRIDARPVARLRAEIASWPTPATTLVPTHGDWQPRNWLIHQGTVSVIDFGKCELQPAMADLTRLAVQDFAGDPQLERTFLTGYGPDPREPEAWHRMQVRSAVSTAAWAHQVGATEFEEQGLTMVRAVLASR